MKKPSTSIRFRFLPLALTIFLVLTAGAAFAASYPAKNIRMIVPYSAGGGTDVMARAVAQFMEGALGTRIAVVNKPGASGAIGTAEVAEARPDGYTIVMLSSNDYLLAPLMNKDPGFKLDDLKLIGSFNDTANCIIVKNGSPFKTFDELIEYAKANPGRLTVSTSGDAHVFLGVMIGDVTGARFSMVSYSGAGESLNSLMGGHVEAAIIDKRFVKQAEQGGCKALAVASDQRYDILPDLPTMNELGYQVLDNQRRILAVPAKTPEAVVDTLTRAVLALGDMPEFKERLTAMSEVIMIETGAELTAWATEAFTRFSGVVEANKERFQKK